MPTSTAKSEAARELPVSTALRLFREIGYGNTTMRAIAAAADVPTASAYSHVASQDDLVHELYRSLQEEHRAVARARAISLFRQAVAMSRPRPPSAIRDDLPELLLSNLVALSRLPVVRKIVVRKIVEDIVRLIRGTRQ